MSTPAEEIGTGSAWSERADAESLLRLGLGKGEPTDAAVTKMLDAAFAVAGPAAMQDILGLCQRWREGLVQQSRQEVERKTSDLRTEWTGRLPDSEHKSAIVTLHVAAYWALRDDTDDFFRSIVRRRRLVDFWDAFEELLRPNIIGRERHGDTDDVESAERVVLGHTQQSEQVLRQLMEFI